MKHIIIDISVPESSKWPKGKKNKPVKNKRSVLQRLSWIVLKFDRLTLTLLELLSGKESQDENIAFSVKYDQSN